jgi:hypothetical protein
MADLVVIVPSRGRPAAVEELIQQFRETCTADTEMFVAVDMDDPGLERYAELVLPAERTFLVQQLSGTMVTALNVGACAATRAAAAIGFMGDDHRPQTVGWDRAYVDALRDLGTGIVYGDDLFQRHRLPTQCAMTADIVQALGYMAPPALTHLYVDNFWLSIGEQAQCIRYLPDVVIEHRHPVAGKAAWDEGYRRVNDGVMYAKDSSAFAEYCHEGLAVDVAKVRALRAGVAA